MPRARISSASISCGCLAALGSGGAVDQLALGGDEVERDVPVFFVDLGQFLEGVRDADQQWFGRTHLLVEKGEAAVVVTAAVAEPIAAAVEAEQRHEHQV